MRNVLAVLLVASFVVAYGCKEEQQQAKEAMQLAKQAQKLAQQAAEEAQKAAGEAAEAAGEAAEDGEASGDAKPVDPQNLQDALAQMKNAIKQNTPDVDPIDFRELKKMLPESVGSMKRKDAKGEKAGAMGVKISNAQGRYEGPDGAKLTIKIVDMGSMKGFAAMAATGWAMAEIDRESDDEWEKTTKHKGYKAFEKYNSKTERGESKLIVGDRFLVEIQGRKVKWKQIEAARDEVPLDDLEDLKNEGVKKK